MMIIEKAVVKMKLKYIPSGHDKSILCFPKYKKLGFIISFSLLLVKYYPAFSFTSFFTVVLSLLLACILLESNPPH